MHICTEVIIVELKIKVAVRVQIHAASDNNGIWSSILPEAVDRPNKQEVSLAVYGKNHSGELINLSRQAEQTNPATLGQLHKDAGSVRPKEFFQWSRVLKAVSLPWKVQANKTEKREWEP